MKLLSIEARLIKPGDKIEGIKVLWCTGSQFTDLMWLGFEGGTGHMRKDQIVVVTRDE